MAHNPLHTLIFRTVPLGCLLATLPVASVGADCGGEPCVLAYRGMLAQSTAVSPEDTWVKEVELGDLDGDGWLDLLMLQKLPGLQIDEAAPNLDVLYLGGADPGFHFQLDPVTHAFTRKPDAIPATVLANRGYDVEFGDFNLDGLMDIIRVDIPGRIDFLTGQPDGSFSHQDALTALGGDPNANCQLFGETCDDQCGGTYDDVDLADLDHDGDLDFVIGQYARCGTNLVVRNDVSSGPGTVPGLPAPLAVEDEPGLVAHWTHAVSVGDANGDCQLDILLGNSPLSIAGAEPPHLFLGQSSTAIQYGLSPDHVFTQIDEREVTSVGDIVGDLGLVCGTDDGIPDNLPDLTGDGDADVFLAQDQIGGAVGLFINTGNLVTPYADSTDCDNCADQGRYDIRYQDLDQDGSMEGIMVAQNFGENAAGACVWDTEMQIVRFDATGFAEVTSDLIDASAFVDTNLGGIAIALGDLDRDGDLDVVLGGVREEGAVVPDPLQCDSQPRPAVFGAAHIYENQLYAEVRERVIDHGSHTIQARRQVTGTDNLTIEGSATITFEAMEKVVLAPGVTVSPSSGSFTARIF